jgi:hypothetical protein
LRHKASPEFWRLYEALPQKIKELADRNFELLKTDPFHPSLRFKQAGRAWSARVGRSWRALAVRDGDDFLWFWIGSHADYDKRLK